LPTRVLARSDVGNVRGRWQCRWNRVLDVWYRHWRGQVWLKAGRRWRAGVTLRLRYADGRSRRHGESEGESKHSRIRVARVEALSVEWVVECYTRGTRHRAVVSGNAGQGSCHKLTGVAPGWTARQRRGWRKSKAERWWSGHASEHTKLQVREHAEAHSKAG
jgi:hypothetical protein